ncbi:MAG TPA: glycoside hydrolase family 172 protein [Ruminiclostridium sp.]
MNLYNKKKKIETHWSSFENITGAKGKGAIDNNGIKGHAFENFISGETKTLLDIEGSGIVNRIWMTVSDRSPEVLKSLRIEMFWDGASTPAVSAPLGDFFCATLGSIVPFENELFSSPEGRSFNTYIPMPFLKKAVIKVKNESKVNLVHLFYDINYSLQPLNNEEIMYFHTCYNRQNPTTLGKDFEIMPKVIGDGRFIGANIGVISNPLFRDSWWGEGEVKVFIDGDIEHPTLVGTGTEDYIGTAWGQGVFSHRYQGCLINDLAIGISTFYRFHIPDPIYFHNDCKVVIQQIGGAFKETLLKIKERGAKFKIISVDEAGKFTGLLNNTCETELEDPAIDSKSWCNFLRQDDVSATAYFYLDTP